MKPYKPLEQLSIKYRGTVLHNMAYMETLMNYYIAEFFCGVDNHVKKDAMQNLILGDDRMSLKPKIDVFVYISKTHDLEWYKSFKGVFKELKLELIHIMEQRNIFAHRIIDNDLIYNDEPTPEGAIRFLSFKNSINKIDYTPERFEELII